uniref:DAGKc domain-containing protein n=1 Tax=Ciona intestinalis TaxID=7719 RepID=F6Q539_CIOIN
MQKRFTRPQNLLIFVNPYGGRHKAQFIYNTTVEPIFNLANIKQTVVVTEYRNHAKQYVETEDISNYDGIIAVGGDGMFNEIANGILLRTQRENEIPVQASSCNTPCYKTPKYKLGVIPAGSTDCMSYVSQGINDPETSALHIVVGDNHPLDMCSIYDDSGSFIRFSFSMTSYGYYGNVLRKSERLRSLGPSRYDFAGVQTFLNKHVYSSEIQFLPSSTKSQATDIRKCRFPCEICTNDIKPPTITTSVAFDSAAPISSISGGDIPDVVRGNFIMVNSAMMSCACARSPQGLSPSAHLADGNMDLILVSDCSRANFIKYMLSHVGKADRFDFPFVEVHRVKAFKHKSLNTESCWNTDGELIDSPNISVWVHTGLITLYARGVEE